MADRGRSVIRERYAWEDVCKAYLKTLVDLAQSRGVAGHATN
jgi:hypothetical protein